MFTVSYRSDTRQDLPPSETYPRRAISPAAELLVNIFMFVDDENISNTIIYVCHQCLLLNKHLIFCEMQWDCRKVPLELERVKAHLARSIRLLVNLSNQGGRYQGQHVLLRA
ncbi:hypothetical protein BGZ96_007268 [Linnemannia gamsii]|uniref:Uncharacterized protein n=1 Tax=Linnemannia gamsii TaxID=64522 RepID=A0ABQ7KFK8_9FUNG|nr:hypothetical protein BGZ96_007268 [Linnemannia gamsii]